MEKSKYLRRKKFKWENNFRKLHHSGPMKSIRFNKKIQSLRVHGTCNYDEINQHLNAIFLSDVLAINQTLRKPISLFGDKNTHIIKILGNWNTEINLQPVTYLLLMTFKFPLIYDRGIVTVATIINLIFKWNLAKIKYA